MEEQLSNDELILGLAKHGVFCNRDSNRNELLAALKEACKDEEVKEGIARDMRMLKKRRKRKVSVRNDYGEEDENVVSDDECDIFKRVKVTTLKRLFEKVGLDAPSSRKKASFAYEKADANRRRVLRALTLTVV